MRNQPEISEQARGGAGRGGQREGRGKGEEEGRGKALPNFSLISP